jgi:predicted NUDIX family NTP pyrophosphohydrolase
MSGFVFVSPMSSIAPNVSAGLLLFRRAPRDEIEVFLAHPGGPFWMKRDEGAWTIPKGEPAEGEGLVEAARREFEEETGFSLAGPLVSLGDVRQKGGKTVYGWACEGDADPAGIRSNTVRCQWPPRSGKWVEVPEIDRCAWFDLAVARRKINVAQVLFLERLEQLLHEADGQNRR